MLIPDNNKILKDEDEEDMMNRNNEKIEGEILKYTTHNMESTSQIQKIWNKTILKNQENIQSAQTITVPTRS